LQQDQLEFLLEDAPKDKQVTKRKSKMMIYGSTKSHASTKVKVLDFSKDY
jgi:hypothetical protein